MLAFVMGALGSLFSVHSPLYEHRIYVLHLAQYSLGW
jgi:hypothetical protein